MVEKLKTNVQERFNLELVCVRFDSQIEEKLVNRREMLVENNISCRRISKEKNIKDFILKNQFVRKLLCNSVLEIKKESGFVNDNPRMMVIKNAKE